MDIATTVVLSYGLGADSTAILLRWLEDPSSRDFEIEDLIVITAMVGDEFDSTARLVEEHVVPRLRAHGVRYVQVARAGRLERDGISVLSDSTCTDRLHVDGAYRLSEELAHAQTVPQYRAYARKCSIKFKGWVLDKWIESELAGAPFRHVLGYESNETRRAERDTSYSTEQRSSEYPLIKWGWNRDACIRYIESVTGAVWPKSCCVFCPFSGGNDEHLSRLEAEPDNAMKALTTEHMALAFNPRQHSLPKEQTFRGKLIEAGKLAVVAKHAELMNGLAWGVYRVQRVSPKKGSFHRSVRRVTENTMTKDEAISALSGFAASEGATVVLEAASRRAYIVERGVEYPIVEDMLVACPAQYEPGDELHDGKETTAFQKYWGALKQLSLFAA